MNLIDLIPVVIAGGIGAYVGSYLREKGKNYATQEDIQKLTKLTEDVKAEVVGSLWLKQKRWDLKKDLYMQVLAEVDGYTRYLGDAVRTLEGGKLPKDELRQAQDHMQKVLGLAGIGHLVFSDESIQTFYRMARRHDELMKQQAAMQENLDRGGPISPESAEYLKALKGTADRLYDDLIAAGKQDLLGLEGAPQ